jgi:predicted Zn-dependent peptidase
MQSTRTSRRRSTGTEYACSARFRKVLHYDAPVQNYVLSELDSGERVVSEQVASVRSVSLGFWIGTGSRDETPENAGVSHFIEHLLFKGTRRYSAQEIAEVFDGLGGELNAATSREHTVVYARVPDHHVGTALELMTDMVFRPSFEDLDNEREVVLEEIAMYEDTPQELVHDLFSEAVFDDHPLGRPVIGTAEVISSLSRDGIAAFHDSAYVGSNIVVAAAGNLEHEHLLEELARVEAGRAPYRDDAHARGLLVQPPPPGLRYARKDTEQYHVCIGAPGISRSDRRRFAASILDAILGGSASSRLFQEIREKRGLVYSVYSYHSQYTEAGVFSSYAGTTPGRAREVIDLLRRELDDVASGGLTAEEFERAKGHVKGSMVLSLEDPGGRMSRIGKSEIAHGEILTVNEALRRVEAVTLDEARRVAERVLSQPMTLTVLGPFAKREFDGALG